MIFNMKAKLTFVFLCLLILPSANSIGISFLEYNNGVSTYPRLSDPDYGVSNYTISQSVTYEVTLNFTLTHKFGPSDYYFKFARLDNRVPNSSSTRYCPPYQESELKYSNITGYESSEILEGHQDRFNNTYDSFNATLPIDGIVTYMVSVEP